MVMEKQKIPNEKVSVHHDLQVTLHRNIKWIQMYEAVCL